MSQPSKSRRVASPLLDLRKPHALVDGLFGEDLHAKTVASLADGTSGVLHAGVIGIHAIGRGIAAAKGLVDKHAIKQVDRLVGNEKLDVLQLCARWTSYMLGHAGPTPWVNLDWTSFDADGHQMLVLSLQGSGRAIPLMWLTVEQEKLKGNQSAYEDQLLRHFRAAVPDGVEPVIVADRGFGDQELMIYLMEELDLDFLIRIRGNIFVRSLIGERRTASRWVGTGGRMKTLKNVSLTAAGTRIPLFVAVQDPGMKQVWCLVGSRADWKGAEVKERYGKRFTCEETFRDIKDMRYGMGLSWTSISKPERRDRLMLLATLAHALLMELGAAGEDAGLDKRLKANTSSKRSLSLFRQGLRWFELLPTLPKPVLRTLLKAFTARLQAHEVLSVLTSESAE